MPNIDVIFTPVDDKTRENLVWTIADTLENELKCAPEAITTRIHEIPATHFAVGNKLLRREFQDSSEPNSNTAKPLCEVRIGWFAGKTEDMENRVVKRLTRNISRILDILPDSVEVGVSVMHHGNYFIAGQRIDVKEP